MNSCRPHGTSAVGWLVALLLVFAVRPSLAQLRIDAIETRPDGMLELRFEADPVSYYRLLSGTEVTEIRAPAGMSFTAPLLTPPISGPARFFIVEQRLRGQSVDTDGDQIPDVYELEHPPLNALDIADGGSDFDGNGRTALQEYLDSLGTALTVVSATYPFQGEEGVSVNRETVFHFSRALAPETVLTRENFFAGAAGRNFLSRVELSSDRKKATLFYLEPIPGSTRVTAVFDGTGIKDERGVEIDGDGDGRPGGMHLAQFDTYSTTAIAGTDISGVVFASRPETDGQGGLRNVPIPGVTITVDGAEETMRATTDAQGRFTLRNSPSGRFFVHVDGRTSPLSAWPQGAYYPVVGKAWEAQGGRTDNLIPGGVVYLPLIPAETLQPVSLTEPTAITFAPSVLAENPDLADVKIVVPPNSLFDNDGKRGGKVGISMVEPARLPEPLPDGLDHVLDISVQTDGPQNFDVPVPACFPNVPNADGVTLPPGAKAFLMSFSHDTGKWEPVGGMTVSADGRLVCTDPGVGIRQAGWHGFQSPPPLPMPPPPPPPLPPPPPPDPFPPCRNTEGGHCRNDCRSQVRGCRHSCDLNLQDTLEGMGAGMEDLTVSAEEAAGNLGEGDDECYDTCEAYGRICRSNCPSMPPCSQTAPAEEPSPEERASGILRGIFALLREVKAAGSATAEQEAAFRQLWTDLRAIVGTRPREFWARAIAGTEAVEAQYTYAAPDRRLPFVARQSYDSSVETTRPDPFRGQVIETNVTPQNVVVRGTMEPFGQFQLFPPAPNQFCRPGPCNPMHVMSNWRLEVFAYDAATRRIGRALGFETSNRFGGTTELNGSFEIFGMTFAPIEEVATEDDDKDGLPNLAEFVLGTNANAADSDNDGISDGAEVDQGLNPLDGRPMATGVIGSVPAAAGEAIDIVAFNDRALLALNNGGLAVMDVTAARLGVLTARIPAPGAVRVVGLSQEFGAAGGSFNGVLALDPRNPEGTGRIVATVLGPVTAIAVEAGVAWVGTEAGLVAMVDLRSGNILDQMSVSAPPVGIAVESGVASVVSYNDLITVEFRSGALVRLGSVALGLSSMDPLTMRRRIAVGDGIAFVNDYEGFARFDVSDPTAPTRISGPANYGPNSFKQILPTGSGAGLAVVGASVVAPAEQQNVQLFDLRDANQNTLAGQIFGTPGVAMGASIYNGLAYVADGAAGLQIVNYLASDTGAAAPTIRLRTSAVEGRAEEGQLLRVGAAVSDDAQVRVVDFYVDDVKIGSDGSYPFEVAFTAPARTETRTSLTVWARAVDTGGNEARTEAMVLELVPDATEPRVLRSAPRPGELLPSLSAVLALMSEPIAPESVTPATVELREAGPDGAFDTADDSLPAGVVAETRDVVPAISIAFTEALPAGRYRILLNAGVKDIAGNPLAAPFAIDFTLFNGGVDTDQDGVPDDVERALGLDPLVADSNGNGVPDGAEDPDGDGLRTDFEVAHRLHPARADTDGNGRNDGAEDSDLDGLTTLREQQLGTNPALADTDDDGWSDEAEVTAGSSASSAASRPTLTIAANPPVSAIAPRAVFEGLTAFGVVIARPHVDVVAPRAVFNESFRLGTVAANPPVSVVAPRAVFGGPFSLGTTIANPRVEVIAPRAVFDGTFSFGTMVANPPTTVEFAPGQ